MKYLVTGGAGFIGYHTAKFLLERNDNVVIVDNFNEYYDPSLKEARISNLKNYPNLEVIKADILDFEVMENIFKNHRFDKICHLAAQAGVRYSIVNPFAYEKSNVLGTLNLLELCRKCNVKHFIFASSSSVYGNNENIPSSETDKADSQISFYAATKKSNEETAHVYHSLYGIHCTGLRIFTAYGPFGRPDMAIFLFTKQILNGEEIKIFNNGDMKRDFTYIDDIVSGIVSALDKSYPFEIFNLARGKQVLLKDFVDEIESNLGIKAKKAYLPLQPGDVKETFGDITKAMKMLNYNPKTTIKEGVKKFVDWYKEYNKLR